MKQLSTVISGFGLLLFVSCGSSENKETKVETPAVNTSATQPASNSAISTVPAATTTVVPTTNNIPVTTTQPVTTTNSTAAGLNPAHGQPGHRCDIAVGAPLNSAPQATTTTAPSTLTPSPVNTSPKVVTTPAAVQPVAAGMNPAHGQPGHRCDISVGAPLNSPVKPTVTPTTTAIKQ